MTSPDTAAQRTTPADITAAVEASFDATPDPRLREVMQALVRHLHAFATEVGLAEDEWRAAIAAPPATGGITHEHRHEFIPWSHTPGVSTLRPGPPHLPPPRAP